MRGQTFRVSFAHMPGGCGLHPNHDGTFAITSGSDGTIRPHDIRDIGENTWWRSEDDVEPDLPDLSITDLHEKPVSTISIAPNSLTLATGCDDGFVRIFSLKGGVKSGKVVVNAELVQACARFGGPVRAMDFSPTGAFLAAAGDEPGVLKLVMTAQPSNVSVLRAGGKAGEAVKELQFDPLSDFVASVGEMGEALIWGVESGKVASVVDLNGRKAKCVAWAPGGELLVWGTDRGIVLVKREGWAFDSLLEDVGEGEEDEDEIYAKSTGKERISALAWSRNGRYLVSAREDFSVALYDVHEKKVLVCWKGNDVAQSVHWHPKSNAVMLIDTIGQWAVVPDVVPSHLPSPHEEMFSVAIPTLPQVDDKHDVNDLLADMGDEDEDVNNVKRSKGAKLLRLKQKEKKRKAEDARARKKKNAEAFDGEDDGNELENGFTFNPSDVDADDEDETRSRGDDDSGNSDDNSEFDEDLGGEFEGLENGGVKLPARRPKSRSRADGVSRRARPELVVQAPFVPTSTPLSEKATKKKRILAWNLVGAVLSFDESTHDVVEIEFADASKRTIGIKDHFGYTMGCLSDIGVLLASPKTKEHGGLITFRPFSSWSNNSDWTQYMHQDEDVSVIALGQRFAAAITTPSGVIRLFSLSGIQTAIFGVSGHVVTAAAGGDSLAIVYTEPDSPVLKCELLDISTTGEVEKVRFSGNVMVCPNSQLEWIGFSKDTGELCSYDSKGWMWMLTDPKNGKRWVPVVQGAAKLGECDWFWVAAATSKHIVGAPCLSNERFPQAKPRPALRSLALSAPVIEKVSASGKPKVIERLIRTKMNLNRAICAKVEADELYDSEDDEVADAEDEVARMEVESDKCILALMEDACRNEHNMRALDLATRLHSKVSFKYAIELAKHFKRSALASRVEQVALRKISVMDDDERARDVNKIRSSPVTPGAGADPESHEACDESAGDVRGRRMPRVASAGESKMRMNFDSDDEGSPQGQDATEEKPKPSFGFDDITDDEDEVSIRPKDTDEKPATPRKAGAPKSRAKDKVAAKPVQRKRSLAMPASQASAKGQVESNAHVSKKQKTAIASKTKGADGKAKGKFRNRFLKK